MADENTPNMDLEQYEADNRVIIDQLIAAEDGPCKKASTASQDMIRRRIRENGFSRKILPPKQVSNADLNRLPDTELPVIVEDMEADQPPAKSISFNDTPDTEFYRGDKFIVTSNQNPPRHPAKDRPRYSAGLSAAWRDWAGWASTLLLPGLGGSGC